MDNPFDSVRTRALLDLDQTLAAPLFDGIDYPWQALSGIRAFILETGPQLSADMYDRIGEDVWIARSASVAATACIMGPTIICAGAEIRHCAYIRGSVIVGEDAVVGNSTELKNAVLFNRVQVPHFNYIGDSILGYRAHLGAGAITSNVKSDKSLLVLHIGDAVIETGLKKFGAIVGDDAEVGCNSVLNPGTILGRRSSVYPTTMVRGIIPPDSIVKERNVIVSREKHG
ncbi:MAG TPA: UDP-N-acetylglucosamine pyrophosphorylase [Clostridia bacterium]